MMAETVFLDVVKRIQQAMCVEPFQPAVQDVVWLIADWRRLERDNQRLDEAYQFGTRRRVMLLKELDRLRAEVEALLLPPQGDTSEGT